MEPFDIDRIIKQKASEFHGLHQQEIDAAKPFVWSEIQRKERTYLTWIHLAAAVLLLMLCFSMILINIQKKHGKEIENLSAKIDQIQNGYAAQTKALNIKTNQIASLTNKQAELNDKLSEQNTAPIPHRERFVYHTDTVFIKQVQYITKTEKPSESDEQPMEKEAFFEQKTSDEIAINPKVDDVIFPSYQSQEKQPETLKVKFGSFASNRN